MVVLIVLHAYHSDPPILGLSYLPHKCLSGDLPVEKAVILFCHGG